MNTTLDVVKRAREALEVAERAFGHPARVKLMQDTITALTAEIERLEKCEPVGMVKRNPSGQVFISWVGDQSVAMLNLIDKPLYTHPAPAVPEGWDAVHLKTGNIYRVVGEAIDATNDLNVNGKLMVIYKSDAQTFVREASEFQDKFAAAPKPEQT